MKTFADRLKYAMQIRNKKQSDLARETNIDKSKLSNYVNGKYQPKQDGYYLLAKALGVSIEWLMGKDVPISSYNGTDPLKKEISSLVSNILNNTDDISKLKLLKNVIISFKD